ncbi:unnamed protein product [Candidula unifasciata]|uniref:Uncharacterized protein n=1 Tax=Candidula unifasciata TaxID=100452 RepID=A0A8S3ZC62_9EUPU|nr:unnamed protein product [Candidula unifasciata]
MLMAKPTKKEDIVGRYGTRFGASLRKIVKQIEKATRMAVGIWKCNRCFKTVAPQVRSAIRRLREIKEIS